MVFGLLALALALAGVWQAARSGALLDRAINAASHQLGGADPLGSVQDLALY